MGESRFLSSSTEGLFDDCIGKLVFADAADTSARREGSEWASEQAHSKVAPAMMPAARQKNVADLMPEASTTGPGSLLACGPNYPATPVLTISASKARLAELNTEWEKEAALLAEIVNTGVAG